MDKKLPPTEFRFEVVYESGKYLYVHGASLEWIEECIKDYMRKHGWVKDDLKNEHFGESCKIAYRNKSWDGFSSENE